MENQKEAVQQKSKETQNQTNKSPGRPHGTSQIPLQATKTYGKDNIKETIYQIENFESYACEKFKENKNLKDINESQKNLVSKLCESVVCSKQKNQWKRTFNACIKDLNKIEQLSVLPEILNIGAEHELTDYPSAILYHSQNIKK